MKNLKPVELTAGLYLVATPIGNMRDITLRAIDVLGAVDLVVCEDTRVTGKLLQAHGMQKKMLSYNDRNATRQRGPILEKLANGGKIALVSDAGMPLISDPGYKLIRDCYDLDLPVTSVPGANAPLTALQLSGLPTDRFSFIGFLPPKSAARKKVLEKWSEAPGTLIIFETGHRLAASLRDMCDVLGDRDAAIVRELTKIYEESRRGRLAELANTYEEEAPPKGEIVVVLAPPAKKEYSDDCLNDYLGEALKEMSVKDAAVFVAEATGCSRKKLYEMALTIGKHPP